MAVLPHLLPLLLVAGLVVGLLLLRSPVTAPARLGAVARSTGRWRLAGLLVGLVVAGAAAQSGALGRGVLLAVPLLCLCVLLGVVVGELRVQPPAADRRSAALEVRSARDYLPRLLAPLVGYGDGPARRAARLHGSGRQCGRPRPGRAALSRACSPSRPEPEVPGPALLRVPLALVVGTGLLRAAVALASIARRPRQGEDRRVDDALRRQSATRSWPRGRPARHGPARRYRCRRRVGAAAGLRRAARLDRGRLRAARRVVPLAVALGTWCAALLVVPGTMRTAEPALR